MFSLSTFINQTFNQMVGPNPIDVKFGVASSISREFILKGFDLNMRAPLCSSSPLTQISPKSNLEEDPNLFSREQGLLRPVFS